MSPEVRFNDLSIGSTAPAKEIEAAVARVLASGWFILGPEVEAFEREIVSSFDCGTPSASATERIRYARL